MFPQEPKPVLQQRSSNNLMQLKAAAASPSGALFSGMQRLQGFAGLRSGKGGLDSPVGSSSPSALTYHALAQASAPDLGGHVLGAGAAAAAGHGHWSREELFAGGAVAGWAGGGLLGSAAPSELVQRSANSAIVNGRVIHRYAKALS